MKIGMNLLLWSTHIGEADFPLLAELKEVGYDGVEFSLNEGEAPHYQMLRKELDRLGLECTTCTAPPEDCNPISPDPAIRKAGVDRLTWAINMTAELGGSVLCGPIHSSFKVFADRGPTEEEKNWSAEVLHQVAEHAKSCGINLAVEFINRFECYLVNNTESALDLIGRVNHPNCGLHYDTHHANIDDKGITDMLELAGDRVYHVHISENDRGTPGKGHINFEETFAALKKINYDRWLTIESFGMDADPAFAAAINVWRSPSPREEVYKEGLAFMKKMWAK